MHLEDQVSAKRCGHRPGKALVSAAEMVDRLKAAVDARADGEFVIMARTDAHAVEGQSAALERAAAYAQAGADMIFAEALQTLEEYRQFADRKSTRLNSSHSQISYAVFCLKKKNPSGQA